LFLTKVLFRHLLVPAALAAGTFHAVVAQDLSPRIAICATCHGQDGNSRAAAIPSLAGQPRTFLENQLIMIREGIRVIPVKSGQLDGITDREVIALSKYFSGQTLIPVASQRDEGLFRRGEHLSREMLCGTCHVSDFKGRDQMPRLAGQRENYLFHSMRQFKNNQATGRDTIMAASLYGIADQDLIAIAHYLSQLK
jgi:cytochrome c553